MCRSYGVWAFLCLPFIGSITSCNQKKSETAGYSDSFKPVFKKVSVLFGTNRLDEGLRYLDSSMNRINKPTIADKFRTYAFHYVYWQKAQHDTKKGLLYADSMLTLAKHSMVNDRRYIPNFVEANFAVGDAYFSRQQFDAAYQHYFQGYVAGKNNLNSGALAEYNYRMGMIMYKMGNYQLATGYFKKSYGLHDDLKDKFTVFYNKQELLDNIALSFKHNNQPDSAILYFDKTLKYLDQYGPQFTDRLKMIDIARGVVYGNKAEVLILQSNYTKAEHLLKKSITINLKKGYDNNDAELAEIKLAQLYYDYKENNALISLLNTMRPQLDSVKNEDADANWNRLMSKYYIRKNDLPKALNYLQTYNTLKDSNAKKVSLLRESDINKQLDNYEKELQIEQLSSNNKYQKIFLFVITVVSLMTLLIILLIYRNWKRSKNDVLKVNLLNQQINEQNLVLEKALKEIKDNSQEKDRILRAVAHDLRNPIGGIASLSAMMIEYEYTDEQKELINLV
ncbi:MAG TPA: hypothetical protein VGC01_03860, partial [Mucilaginibacter sp.]